MTNQEAIRILESMKDELILAFDHDRKEALKLAISALQAQYSIRICDTCKHDPPEMDKWPCMDCDMREPADRWEAKDVPDINVGDMISRQAAIEAAIKATDDWDGGYNITRANMIEKELNDLPSAEPEQRWIPCSERLPEQYGNYLVSIEGEEPDIGSINPNDPRGWSLCDANGFYWASNKMLNVTAWMPLPKPYGGDLDE